MVDIAGVWPRILHGLGGHPTQRVKLAFTAGVSKRVAWAWAVWIEPSVFWPLPTTIPIPSHPTSATKPNPQHQQDDGGGQPQAAFPARVGQFELEAA